MRITRSISLLACAAALAACSVEAPKESGAAVPDPTVTDTSEGTAPGSTEGPAGEVAPDSRVPVEKPQMPEGLDEKWAVYFEKIPFVFGSEAGLARAAETGKPMMMFYSATW